MPTSYNGWSASPTLSIRPLVIEGEAFIPGIRNNDDVYVIFQYLAQNIHDHVEAIVRADWHQADDWGFSYRASTGNAFALSCHASGTAIDYNATRHPYGVHGTWSAAAIAEIHKILAEVQVVEWGNDWNLPDGMHFEIDGTAAEVAAAANRIRNLQEENPMADEILARLNTLEQKQDRALGQNSRIIRKLNKQMQKQDAVALQLEAIMDEVEPGSKLHKKVQTLIKELRAHDAELDEEPETP